MTTTAPLLLAAFTRQCETAIRNGKDPLIVWLAWRSEPDVDSDELLAIAKSLTGARSSGV